MDTSSGLLPVVKRRVKEMVKRSPLGQPVRWLLARRRWTSVTVADVRLTIRKGTPDLEVAEAGLTGEFDVLRTIMTRTRFDFIIDAGGYIGTAAIALSRMFPHATVISLEPSKVNYALLKRNVRPFPNVIAVNKALLSDVRRVALRDRQTGEWGYTVVGSPSDNPSADKLHDTETTTIAALLEEHKKEGIDILKLDIEGAEKTVLECSQPWISRTAVLIVELHDRICPGCAAAFETATTGLTCLPISSEKQLAVNQSLIGAP